MRTGLKARVQRMESSMGVGRPLPRPSQLLVNACRQVGIAGTDEEIVVKLKNDLIAKGCADFGQWMQMVLLQANKIASESVRYRFPSDSTAGHKAKTPNRNDSAGQL